MNALIRNRTIPFAVDTTTQITAMKAKTPIIVSNIFIITSSFHLYTINMSVLGCYENHIMTIFYFEIVAPISLNLKSESLIPYDLSQSFAKINSAQSKWESKKPFHLSS